MYLHRVKHIMLSEKKSANKRVAKNVIFLYFDTIWYLNIALFKVMYEFKTYAKN